MWPKSISEVFSPKGIQKKTQSLINLNESSHSAQGTVSLQRVKDMVNEKKQEKSQTISLKHPSGTNSREEVKKNNEGILLMIREKVPIFIGIQDSMPENFPNALQISDYLSQEFNVNPKTISYCWLPLESLKREGRFNNNFQKNVNLLKTKHAAWRKVRGDGNCYYRSVISAYLLKIFHPSTNPNYCHSFMQKLILHKSNSNSLEFLYSTLNPIFSECQSGISPLNYLKIEKLLQNYEFDQWLIQTARYLTEIAIEDFSEFNHFVGDTEKNNVIHNIRTMGNEAEGVELFLLPTALDIVVEQANLFDNILYSKFPSDDSNKVCIQIISKSKGHYDMLLSNRDVEVQQYSVNELIYYHN